MTRFTPAARISAIPLREWRNSVLWLSQRLDLIEFTLRLLTVLSIAFLEKLTGFQLINKFPAFYGTSRFIGGTP